MSKIKPFNYNLATTKSMAKKELPEVKQPIVVQFPEGVEFIKGEKPTEKEIIEIVTPIIKANIPPPEKGEPGDNYILTDADKNEISKKIKPLPPIVKVIERTEVVREKNVILKDAPEQVRDKLESLKKGKKLTIYAIEELPEILEELRKMNKGVGGKDPHGGNTKGSIYGGLPKQIRFVDDEVPSEVPNGIITTFTTAHVPATGSLKVYLGGIRLKSTEWTISGKTVTLAGAPGTGETVLFDYRRG